MHTSNQTHSHDVVAYIDRYQLYENNLKYKYGVDPKLEAQYLKMLVTVFGQYIRLVAVIDQDDKEGLLAYGSEGYSLHTMNGNRPAELMQLVTDESAQQNKNPPKRVVVVSNDPTFGMLCSIAAQNNVEVLVWVPSAKIPQQWNNYNVRQLSELLPHVHIKEPNVVVRLDIENLLIGLKKAGSIPNTSAFVEAIKAEISDLGNTTSIIAYADWHLLSMETGRDIQRELEQLGVKTRYQINMRGKNSADMEIASDIHSLLERDPNVDVIVIGTGDRDFRPTIETARSKSKKVIVLTLKDSLSHQLKLAADQVRYLDKYFKAQKQAPSTNGKKVNPVGELTVPLMRLAHLLRQNRWQYAYTDKLDGIASPEQLRRAVEVGMLKPRHPDCAKTHALNLSHPKAKAVHHMVWWIPSRLDYLLNTKGMPHVDTNFLVKGAGMNKKCQELGIGQNWNDVKAWLEAAKDSGLIVKKQQPHPKNPNKVIDTWWLAGHQNEQATQQITAPPSTETPSPQEDTDVSGEQAKPINESRATHNDNSPPPTAF